MSHTGSDMWDCLLPPCLEHLRFCLDLLSEQVRETDPSLNVALGRFSEVATTHNQHVVGKHELRMKSAAAVASDVTAAGVEAPEARRLVVRSAAVLVRVENSAFHMALPRTLESTHSQAVRFILMELKIAF